MSQRHRMMAMHPRIPSVESLQWSIKIAAPFGRRFWWGDFHFAAGLARAMERLGQHVRIDSEENWYNPTSNDEVVLVLRGLKRYRPAPEHVNLQWVISHPEEVTADEWNSFDRSFVASIGVPATPRGSRPGVTEQLLQATDPERFSPGPVEPQLRHDVLFVGNSRWRLRRAVQDALAVGLPLSVYGDGWANLLPAGVLHGERIPNKELPRYYRSAGAVLNDHWEDMKRGAFLSNRLFDAAACAAPVVSDGVDGIAAVFGEAVYTYEHPHELARIVTHLLDNPHLDRDMRRELAQQIRTHHTFEVRARRLVAVAQSLVAERYTRAYEDGHSTVAQDTA